MAGGWNDIFRSGWLGLLIKFLLAALALLALWWPVSWCWLRCLFVIGRLYFLLIDWPLTLELYDGVLKFVAAMPTGDDVRCTVGNIDEVYLNLVLLIALYAAVYTAPRSRYLAWFGVSVSALLLVHGGALVLYAATTVPDLLAASGHPDAAEVATAVATGLPGISPATAQTLLFHWHAWGWDVLPVLLWLPVSGVNKLLQRVP